jgi:Family of unknown function (DUF6452)
MSCKQKQVCLIPQGVSCQGAFFQKDSADNLKDSLLQGANIFFQGKDSIYLYKVIKSNRFSLPPSITSDSTQFIFQSDSSTTNPSTIDTINLFYTRELKFISVACGFQTEFTLTKISHTKNVIDSTIIAVPKIDANVNTQHIQFVLKN